MSYTFGAALTDIVHITPPSLLYLGGQRDIFFTGWFYPTSLTPARWYWSVGSVAGAQVATDSSEILLTTNNTVDGTWLTSGLGMVTDKWQFLAFLCSPDVAGAWRVWRGDKETAPIVNTPAVVTPVTGGFTGSGNLCLGNLGPTGALAFQGDIGAFTAMTVFGASYRRPIPHELNGVITDADAALIERRLVLPFWRGVLNNSLYSFAGNSSWGNLSIDLTAPLVRVQQRSNFVASGNLTPTIVGATFSEHQPPVRLPANFPGRFLVDGGL